MRNVDTQMTSSNRLTMIQSRFHDNLVFGSDMAWLLEEVKRLRAAMPPVVVTYSYGGPIGIHDAKALLARAERERRHGEWAMRRVELLKGQRNSAVHAFLDEALNSEKGEYKP